MKNLLEWIYVRLPLIRELKYLTARVMALEGKLGCLQNILALTAADAHVRNNPHFQDPKRLLAYSFQVNSQSGEDGILAEIFRRIGVVHRTFLEIGVEDGTQCNTAFLVAQNWQGWWIDGSCEHQTRFNDLRLARGLPPDRLLFHQALVTRENIVAILKEIGVPEEVDVFSLDIDYNTYYIWEALVQFKPRVIVIEYNSAIPPECDWKVPYDPGRTTVWDGSQNFGASLKAYEKLGNERGYVLVGCDGLGINAFFVRQDLVGDHFCQPYTAENHYELPRYSFINQPTNRPELLISRQTK